MSTEFGSSSLGLHHHVVQFYERDEELTENAGDYLAGAIAEGGAAVVVATPGHCAAFEARLAAGGVEVGAARRDGTLVCLDATRLAPRLPRAGRIDLAAFDTQFRPAILAAGEAPGPVRIYGEIVALLWAAGEVNAALELEGLWNELGRQIPFSLFCGYPRDLVQSSQHQGAVAEICGLHSAVIGHPRAGAPVTGPSAKGPSAAGRPGGRSRNGRWLSGRSLPSPGPLGRRHAHVREKPRGHPGGSGLRAQHARAVAW